jgi:hypothetical protein
MDEFIWAGKGWASKEGFDLARQALHSKVEDLLLDVYDLGPEKVGKFDLVLDLRLSAAGTIGYYLWRPATLSPPRNSIARGRSPY